MDKYLSAYELLKRLGKKTIQLFNLCKKGELQPYNWREEKIVTLDSCKDTNEFKEFILKRKQELKRIINGSEAAGSFYGDPGISSPNIPITDEKLEKEAIKDFRPKSCELFDYTLPISDSAAKQKLKKFLHFIFKESDVERYEIEHGLFEAKKDVLEIEQAANDIIEKKIFPCAPGTRWEEVRITLTDNETVRVKTPQGEGLFTYHQLGMSDRRVGNKPTVLWPLFKQFCENQGFISADGSEYFSNIATTAKRLNAHLKKLFRINESIYEGHYKKLKKMYSDHEIGPDQNIETASREPGRKGYKTRIFFSDQTKVVE